MKDGIGNAEEGPEQEEKEEEEKKEEKKKRAKEGEGAGTKLKGETLVEEKLAGGFGSEEVEEMEEGEEDGGGVWRELGRGGGGWGGWERNGQG